MSSFLESNFLPHHNPNLNTHINNGEVGTAVDINYQNLGPFDLLLAEGFETDLNTSTLFTSLSSQTPETHSATNINSLNTADMPRRPNDEDGQKRMKKMDEKKKIAFRTKSGIEIMDDGFKWKKYGKKAVKSSPNPRNYFRCSNEGCKVKKRVERDREDSSYVITTYVGVHNHESPFANDQRIHFNRCTLQPLHHSTNKSG